MTDMDYRKMEELVADKAFVQKLKDAGSVEPMYKLFAENGLNASYEDFAADIQKAKEMVDGIDIVSEDGELTPAMLDLVSGGSARGRMLLLATGVLCLCAGSPGIAVACFGLAALH